ncbi:hypothetical protein SCHPADRAFT_947068 [Schizopora paradoxa]|uniref:Ribonuclease H1 N-terminal domain-containing protein n=1 Tax=Schizopora paradoxa TaxID=27342 RepID=A0A0H2R0E8_9AGAM|nr:hypothetical protein SCHPADRAFT_947068 [Schizopora paradoxa]
MGSREETLLTSETVLRLSPREIASLSTDSARTLLGFALATFRDLNQNVPLKASSSRFYSVDAIESYSHLTSDRITAMDGGVVKLILVVLINNIQDRRMGDTRRTIPPTATFTPYSHTDSREQTRSTQYEYIPVGMFAGPNGFRRNPDFYYPVAKGKEVGIFWNWPYVERQVLSVQGARFAKKYTFEKAFEWLEDEARKQGGYLIRVRK